MLPPHLKPQPPVGVTMAASSFRWTLGDGWQHGSRGLSGTVTQGSCWHANTTSSQSSYSINSGQPLAHRALLHGRGLHARISP